jgi:hypothetical protein
MTLTKREKTLIERYKKSGRTVDQEKLDARFRFLVRPLATIGLDAGKFALWFEEEISKAIKEAGLEFSISSVVISPHIVDPTTSSRPSDGVVFKRSENAVFVAASIDHHTWLLSSDSTKLMSMHENIRHSVLKLPQKYVDDNVREALLGIIDNVYARLRSRLVH